MTQKDLPRALLLLTTLLATAFAGCTGDTGPSGSEDGLDEGMAEPPGGPPEAVPPPPTRPPPPSDPREAAALRVRAGLERLGGEPGHFLMTVETSEPARTGERTSETLLVDSANGTSFYRLLSERATGTGSESLVAQVGKTYLTGKANASLLVVRDENATPFETARNLSELALNGKLPAPLLGSYYAVPALALTRAGYVPGAMASEVEAVEVEGRAATRVSFGAPGRTGAVFLLEDATDHILGANFTQSTSSSTKYGNVTFRYGAAAAHPWSAALARAGTMAVLDAPGFRAIQMQPRETAEHTWTVQPSAGAAKVPLSDIELRLYPRSGPERNPPLVTLPLEKGGETGPMATLAFEDADGDGHVSAGDRVTVRITRDRHDLSDYVAALVDETTAFVVQVA